MNCKENRNEKNTAAVAHAMKNSGRAMRQACRSMEATGRAAEELGNLNTMRGGAKGFKGFVGESLEAREASALGRRTQVIGDNGIADLRWTKTDGTEALRQMKIGYRPGQIDFGRYQGQTLVLDKGNPHLAELQAEGAKHGVKVVEGHITEAEAQRLADAMQLETRITGGKHATVTTKLYQGMEDAAALHEVGVNAAKHGAIAGAGFSIGSNFVKVAKGEKSVGEAAGDVALDTAAAGAVSYGSGVAAGLVASTETGAALMSTAGAAGAALAEAPVIGSLVGAGSAAAGTIGAAGTAAATAAAGAATGAVTAAAGAATSIAAGTALGGTVAAATGAAVATTAALGAAAVAAAPVLAVGAVVGGLFSLFSD